ncbi:MAG: KUP/HAK/KT family potassium transporter [Gammaproteobacteria bacterium]
MSLTALGIVYGDIGTSPLYALRECFMGSGGVAITNANVLGVLSLIFWALIIVISVKYLIFVMRADNRGEGGILALIALLRRGRSRETKGASVLLLMGVFGAALLYGDGMITPAISVMSAVEGLKVAEPRLHEFVIPLTIVILVLLFAGQKHGTQRIGSVFGPIMLLWFVVLAVLGVHGILHNPHVLTAINPVYAVRFFLDNPPTSYLVLGGVFLVVTGGEALYADMGHFGRRPIRLAWFGLVLPALLLNYFGQGALILDHPVLVHHPFYNLVPHWAVYPMIGLATVTTVIASQAVISGTFSLTRQAVQMGQSPPIEIIQTSSQEMGQIYVPFVNWALLVATVSLVVGFGSSSNLAGAYGVAVSTTMVITTILAYFVMRRRWRWSPALALLVVAGFLTVDLAFLGANLFKIIEGGWFPLVIGGLVLLLMSTWAGGRRLVEGRGSSRTMPIDAFLASFEQGHPQRVPGTAVFLTPRGNHVSSGLLHHLKLNQMLHERVILLTVINENIPSVPASGRLEVQPLRHGFYRLYVYYGFMQSPNVSVAMKLCQDQNLIPGLEAETTVFYSDRSTYVVTGEGEEMPTWRKRLYAVMARNAQRATEFYHLPTGRSVELGIRMEI